MRGRLGVSFGLQPSRPASTQSRRKADRGPRQTILLIESDPANLIAESLILRCLGYTVLETASRSEAWHVLHKHGPPIHLVVAKGIQDNHRTKDFVARLRLACPQIRALFISEASSAELADNQSMPRESAILQKPIRLETLASVIRELLDEPKKRAVSSIS